MQYYTYGGADERKLMECTLTNNSFTVSVKTLIWVKDGAVQR